MQCILTILNAISMRMYNSVMQNVKLQMVMLLQLTYKQEYSSINVTNTTEIRIQHLYFTLFDQNKYDFRPMVFSLDAGQSIDITVFNLRIQSAKHTREQVPTHDLDRTQNSGDSHKDSAYLKWKGGKKRLPIHWMYVQIDENTVELQKGKKTPALEHKHDQQGSTDFQRLICRQSDVVDKLTSVVDKVEDICQKDHMKQKHVLSSRSKTIKQTIKLPIQSDITRNNQLAISPTIQHHQQLAYQSYPPCFEAIINHLNHTHSIELLQLQNIINQQQQVLRSHQKQLFLLSNQYQYLHQQNRQYEISMKQLMEKQATIKQMYISSKDTNVQLQSLINQSDHEKQLISSKYQQVLNQSKEYQNSIAELSRNYAKEQQINAELSALNQKLKKENEQLQRNIHLQQQKIGQLSINQQSLHQTNRQTAQKWDQQKLGLQNLIKNLQTSLAAQTKKYNGILNQMQSIHKEHTVTTHKLMQKIQQRNNKQQQYNLALGKAKQTIEKTTQSNSRLLQQIDRHQKIIDKLQERDLHSIDKHRQLLQNQQTVTTECRQLSKELDQAKCTISELESMITQLKKNRDLLQVQLSKLAEQFSVEYQCDRASQTNELSSLRFLQDLSQKLNQHYIPSQIHDTVQKQNSYLKGRLQSLEKQQQQPSKSVLELIRAEMRTQYRNMYQNLQMSESKHRCFKKKIYEDYRLKIIKMMDNHGDEAVKQLENTLQRFIRHLSNYSHKQAILAKEIRNRDEARKQLQLIQSKLSRTSNCVEKTTQSPCTKCFHKTQIIGVNDHQACKQSLQLLKQQGANLTLTTQNMHLQAQLAQLKQKHESIIQQVNQLSKEVSCKTLTIAELEDDLIRMKETAQEYKQNYVQDANDQCGLRDSHKLQRQKIMKQSVNLGAELMSKKSEVKSLKMQIKTDQQQIKKLLKEISMLKDDCNEQARELRRMQNSLKEYRSLNHKLKEQNHQFKEKIDHLSTQTKKAQNLVKMYQHENEQLKVRVTVLERIRCNQIDCVDSKQYWKTHDSVRNSQKLAEIQSLESTVRSLLELLRKIFSQLQMTVMKNQWSEQSTLKQKYGRAYSFLRSSDQTVSQPDIVAVDAIISNVLTTVLG